ncbi:MAG: hypothetical protein BGO90_14970 [Legionella sp. 40-6]|nr:hypothetical protein [Legionella sp.]OJY39458.1 MAG: hypothetical protein BGO90_14970 [Legionella sp. 40-6]
MYQNILKKIIVASISTLLLMTTATAEQAQIKLNLISEKTKEIRPCPHPSFAYCTLTISSGTGFTGSIQITNQSTSITAQNVTAIIPGSLSGVVFPNPPTSITLSPGTSGVLSFTGSTISPIPPTLVEVKGDNTQSGFFYIEVLP